MAKLRLLVVQKSNGNVLSGDRIRTEEILNVLKSYNFEVLEARLPSLTKECLFRTSELCRLILALLPLHSGVMQIRSCKALVQYLDLNSSMNYLRMIMRRTKPNIVLAEKSHVGWVATRVCKEFSIDCIVDTHGLGFLEAKGRGETNWQQVKTIEEEAFRDCDLLLVVSARMKDYIIREFRISSKKVVVVPNGSTPQRLTAQFNLPLKVIYAGIFSYWEKVHDFLDVAGQADQKLFKFYVAGTGPLKKQLLEKIQREKIPVIYLDYVPRSKMSAVFSKMQVGIAPSTRDLARQVASPIKVFDYMASGLPVITPNIGDWGDIIKSEDCGIALDEDSIEKYLEALNTLASKDIWKRKSTNAIRVIEEQYSWTKLLQPLIDSLLDIASLQNKRWR